MKMNKTKWAILILGTVIVVAAATPHWTGIRSDKIRTGTYISLNSCRKEVEKSGGWCGRGCELYSDGTTTDCDPLVVVSKK